jgi:hypothetical protein
MRGRVAVVVTMVAAAACLAVPLAAGAAPAQATAAAVPCEYGNPNGGYLATTQNGQVFTFGTATAHGTLADRTLSRPITGIASTPGGAGYWLAGTDGGIFSFGDARFYGSTGGLHLSRPVVGMAATPDGKGYWLVASDGGIFSFGDAPFYGSTGAMHLSQPIVGMAATPDGKGYWLVASDGGIFSFGDARFYGSTGAMHLGQPIVGMAATPDGKGYWLVAADGGIFSFGHARFYGSATDARRGGPIVGIAATPDGRGYTLVGADGSTYPFGSATFQGTFAGGLAANPVSAVAAVPGTPALSPLATVLTYGITQYPYGDYYYAGAEQWPYLGTGATGASVQMCQANPVFGPAGTVGHSLTEMALSGPASGDYLEFISISTNSGPWLWTTWWLDGQFQGSSGFVQVSKTIVSGMSLTVGSTASYAVEQAGGRWNYYYDGQFVGYFPDSLWSGAFTNVTHVQVFGEVSTTLGTAPDAQMGDGILGWQAGSAIVNGYQLFGSSTRAAFTDAYETATYPDYDYAVGPITSTSFGYGGPGAS